MEQKRSFGEIGVAVLLGLIGLAVVVIFSIILPFISCSSVFYGIVNMIAIALPVVGGIVAYIKDKNILSVPMIFNFIVLAITLIAM